MNTKTLNTYEKLWLANRASHNMALAGPTAFWLASGHREARPLYLLLVVYNVQAYYGRKKYPDPLSFITFI